MNIFKTPILTILLFFTIYSCQNDNIPDNIDVGCILSQINCSNCINHNVYYSDSSTYTTNFSGHIHTPSYSNGFLTYVSIRQPNTIYGDQVNFDYNSDNKVTTISESWLQFMWKLPAISTNFIYNNNEKFDSVYYHTRSANLDGGIDDVIHKRIKVVWGNDNILETIEVDNNNQIIKHIKYYYTSERNIMYQLAPYWDNLEYFFSKNKLSSYEIISSSTSKIDINSEYQDTCLTKLYSPLFELEIGYF